MKLRNKNYRANFSNCKSWFLLFSRETSIYLAWNCRCTADTVKLLFCNSVEFKIPHKKINFIFCISFEKFSCVIKWVWQPGNWYLSLIRSDYSPSVTLWGAWLQSSMLTMWAVKLFYCNLYADRRKANTSNSIEYSSLEHKSVRVSYKAKG